MTVSGRRTVLFVCPHGAGKSRIAAAWFCGLGVAGWTATSAGVQPQAQVSVHAARLLAGTPVLALLDEALPRPMSAVSQADLLVAIDCAPEVGADVRWTLAHQDFDEWMCAEIRDRVEHLVASLAADAPAVTPGSDPGPGRAELGAAGYSDAGFGRHHGVGVPTRLRPTVC